MSVQELLPAASAALVSASGIAVWVGLRRIRRGEREAHRRAMITATVLAAGFLVIYLVRTALFGSTPFEGPASVRAVYLAVLGSHMVLAAISTPLVLVTLRRGLAGRFDAHRRIARPTVAMWLYVSVTGLIVYLMLYQLQ